MSQSELILRDLKRGKTITPISALNNYGCFRLGARIWSLKKAGFAIESKLIKRNGKRYSGYRLAA